MKKTSFYSLVRENGETVAKLWRGYSDGTFYYYNNNGWWHSIHPLTGLGVSSGATRKEVAQASHKKSIFDGIQAHMERNGAELTRRFENAIQTLKEAQQCI